MNIYVLVLIQIHPTGKITKLCVCEHVRATAVIQTNSREKYYSNPLLPSGKCVRVREVLERV